MPPHLHPRSWTTTSLFGTTLAISFLVVGMPHLLPCPAPRAAFADVEVTSDGRRIRRTRTTQSLDRRKDESEEKGECPSADINATEKAMLAEMDQAKARECPVPKPGGALGRVLGFRQEK